MTREYISFVILRITKVKLFEIKFILKRLNNYYIKCDFSLASKYKRYIMILFKRGGGRKIMMSKYDLLQIRLQLKLF